MPGHHKPAPPHPRTGQQDIELVHHHGDSHFTINIFCWKANQRLLVEKVTYKSATAATEAFRWFIQHHKLLTDYGSVVDVTGTSRGL